MADVTFVIHASRDISGRLQEQKDFVKNYIEGLPPYGANGIRIAVVTYGREAQVPIDLEGYRLYRSKSDLQRRIDGLDFAQENGANFSEVFQALLSRVYSRETGMREDSVKIVIWLLGYGQQNQRILEDSQRTRFRNIGVYAIGFSIDIQFDVLLALAWNSEFAQRTPALAGLNIGNIIRRSSQLSGGRFEQKGRMALSKRCSIVFWARMMALILGDKMRPFNAQHHVFSFLFTRP